MNTNSNSPIVEVKSFRTEMLETLPKWQSVCETAAVSKVTPSYGVMSFVVEFEEKELEELTNTSSNLYSAFVARMKSVATASNVNLFVFIGHSDICLNYVNEIKTRIENGSLVVNNSLPSVILIIGCLGEQYLSKYLHNQEYESLRDKKFHFFGFQNLVHIYKGKIYNCEKPHKKVPKLDCKHIETEAGQKACCKAKQGDFERSFIEFLNDRGCTEISDQKMIEKFKQLRSGVDFPSNFFLFGASDGTPCTKTAPCLTPSSNMINSNQKSKAFNEMAISLDDKWAGLIELYLDPGITTKEFIDHLRKLKKIELPLIIHEYSQSSISYYDTFRRTRKDLSITYLNNTLILFAIGYYDYELIYYLLTQKSIEIPNLSLVLGKILWNFSKETEDRYTNYGNWRESIRRNISMFYNWQIYNLLTIIYEKDPTVFLSFIHNKGSFLYKTPFLLSLAGKNHPAIYSFFYTHFQGKINWNELSEYENPDDRLLDLEQTIQIQIDDVNYNFLLYLGLMGADLNLLNLRQQLSDYLPTIQDWISSTEDSEIIINTFKYLFAFGYNNGGSERYIEYLIEDIMSTNFVYEDAKNSQSNRDVQDKLCSLIVGSETYDKTYAKEVREEGRVVFENYLRKYITQNRLAENFEARKQFSKVQGEIGKLLKKLPESERELYFKNIDYIVYEGRIPEWRRLQQLQNSILEPLQRDPRTQPRRNTTVRNTQGGRRRLRKTRRNH